MKIRLLSTLIVLSTISLSLKANDDYNGPRLFRVNDDHTKVGADFDNGAGIDLFGLNVGLYGKSKQKNNSCDCDCLQYKLNNASSDKEASNLRKKMRDGKCNKNMPRRAGRRQSSYSDDN